MEVAKDKENKEPEDKNERLEGSKEPQITFSSGTNGRGNNTGAEDDPQSPSEEDPDEETNDTNDGDLRSPTDEPADEGPTKADNFAKVIGGEMDLTEEGFNLLVEVGNKLLDIGQTKPSGDLVRQELKKIVRQLMRLLYVDLEMATLNAELEEPV